VLAILTRPALESDSKSTVAANVAGPGVMSTTGTLLIGDDLDRRGARTPGRCTRRRAARVGALCARVPIPKRRVLKPAIDTFEDDSSGHEGAKRRVA
jgi:hypothetical protein